jgi:4-amino-4-deoxy-L-arabinose transferase-like glycosyltransferase
VMAPMTGRAHPAQSGPARKNRVYVFQWRYALLVFLVAVCMRGIYLVEACRQPDFNVFYMDEQYNLEWAKSLATGAWTEPYAELRSAPYFRAPLYSFLLAGIFKLLGVKTLLARIVQVLMGSVSCALAYAVATKCLGQRVGIVTGFLCSLYWVLVYFDSQFLQPVLLVFLLLAGLLAAFTAAEKHRIHLAGVAGLCFGLYAITRPEILVAAPFIIWWAVKATGAFPQPGRRWFVLALAIGFALPPAAATLRNRVVAHDWVVVASQGGVNFYIGNNPESNGMQAVVPGTRATWWGGYQDTRAIAEKAAGHALKASEVSRYWYRQGLAFVRDDPGRWLGLTLRKAALFVGNVEIPNNEPYEAHRRNYLVLGVPLGFGLLFGLFVVSLPGLLGIRFGAPRSSDQSGDGGDPMRRLRRHNVALILQLMAVYAVTTIAFFVTGRYRVPLVPLVAMGAGAALVAMYEHLKSRRLATFAAMVAATAVIAGLLSIDHFGVRRSTEGFVEYTDALDLLDTGDLDGAIAGLEAVRSRHSVRDPHVYISLARAYIARGRSDDSKAILAVAEEGLRSYPDEAELLWYASLGHVVAKDWSLARDRLERFLAQKPDDLRGLHLALVTALAQGRIVDARSLLARAEVIDSSDPIVQDMRARLAAQGGAVVP